MKVSNSAHKTALLKAIQTMDLNLLEICLDDKRTYSDLSKEDFIKIVASYFEKMKSGGDVELDKIGMKCNHCYLNTNGFVFCGKNSKQHFSFLFQENKDEVIDLFDCTNYCSEEKLEGFNGIDEYIWEDMKKYFVPDERYIHRMQPCKNAIAEVRLLIEQKKVLSLEDCQRIQKNYEEMFEAINIAYIKYSFEKDFWEEVKALETAIKLNEFNPVSKIAMDELNEVALADEEKLVDWLSEYNHLYDEAFFLTLTASNIYFVHTENNELEIAHIDRACMQHTLDFLKHYEINKSLLYEKYGDMMKHYFEDNKMEGEEQAKYRYDLRWVIKTFGKSS
jgi:hypothetical protein